MAWPTVVLLLVPWSNRCPIDWMDKLYTSAQYKPLLHLSSSSRATNNCKSSPRGQSQEIRQYLEGANQSEESIVSFFLDYATLRPLKAAALAENQDTRLLRFFICLAIPHHPSNRWAASPFKRIVIAAACYRLNEICKSDSFLYHWNDYVSPIIRMEQVHYAIILSRAQVAFG